MRAILKLMLTLFPITMLLACDVAETHKPDSKLVQNAAQPMKQEKNLQR